MDTQVNIEFEPIEPNKNNNKVQVFSNPQFGEIRTTGTPNEPLFCLADLCRVLELQTGATKNRLDQKGISLINTLTQGGEQQMVFISEKNLYKLIMRSDKPQAEPFQDWVCGEVLPSIRKHGGYIAAQPEDDPELILAKALQIADATIKRTQKKLQQVQEENKRQTLLIEQKNEEIEKIKKEYADLIKDLEVKDNEIKFLRDADEFGRGFVTSNGVMTFEIVAKSIIGMRTDDQLRKWCLERKIIYCTGKVCGANEYVPYADYAGSAENGGRGWFVSKPNYLPKSDGSTVRVASTLKITTKGAAALKIMYERWLKRNSKKKFRLSTIKKKQ